MKRLTVTMAAILLVVSMSACGGKKEAVPTEPVTTAATEPETTVPETTIAPETTSAMTGESKTIIGEILDAAMNTIIIRTEDGKDLIFGKEDAETDLENGLVIGNSVIIEYTGEIDGTNASEAKVLKISDHAAESMTITGEVLDGSMTTIMIKTEDGKELMFDTVDAETDYKDGLLIGNSVAIEYTGEINGTDVSGATVLKISDYKAD